MRRRLLFTFLVVGASIVCYETWGYRLFGPRIAVRDIEFSIEIARTAEEQERGLGFRDSLCRHCGMLFVFDHPDEYAFWMKGMRFPLDMIWIRDGKIISIERNVDFLDQQQAYRPDGSADMVLELNSGVSERHRFSKGDTVRIIGR